MQDRREPVDAAYISAVGPVTDDVRTAATAAVRNLLSVYAKKLVSISAKRDHPRDRSVVYVGYGTYIDRIS